MPTPDNTNCLLVCVLAGFIFWHSKDWTCLTFSGWGWGFTALKNTSAEPALPKPARTGQRR